MNADDWIGLGLDKKRKGLYREALKCYKESEKLDSEFEGLYNSLGKIYYILGERENSIEAYVKSIELSGCPKKELISLPGGINILIHLGHALIDDRSSEMYKYYRCTIDPYYKDKNNFKFNLGMNEINEYENECIIKAYEMLQHLEDTKFLNFISSLTRSQIEGELNFVYKVLKKNVVHKKAFGFKYNGVKELAGSICLLKAYPSLEKDIFLAICKVMLGNISPLGFSDCMDDIIKRSPISEQAWHATYRHFDKNHKWLEQHIFSKGEV